MSNNINDCKRLLKKCAVINFMHGNDGKSITPLIIGTHGIGKSQIIVQAAKEMGGEAFCVDGTSVNEGEIPGLPFISKNSNGTSEVQFAPYWVVARIQRKERYYYEHAKKGFLNGKLKLLDDGTSVMLKANGDAEKIFTERSNEDNELDPLNRFKFFENIPGKYKLELIKRHEVRPVFFFIDEIMGMREQARKELQNIILNRRINGYELPWFVFFVTAGNPAGSQTLYSTTEMTPALQDRFLKLTVTTSIDDWITYAMKNDIPIEYVNAIASNTDKTFQMTGEGYDDTTVMTPSPRSHEICSRIYEAYKTVFNDLSLFTKDEISKNRDDLVALLTGKIGPISARAVLAGLENNKNNIPPDQIVDGSSPNIKKEIIAQIKELRTLSQHVVAMSLIRYIVNTLDTFKNAKTAEGKKRYTNYKSQIGEFVKILDSAAQFNFIRQCLEEKTKSGTCIFYPISSSFDAEALRNITAVTSVVIE